MLGAERFTRGFDDFQRADDAPHIAGVNVGGGFGVEGLQAGVERLRAFARRQGFHRAAKLGVGRHARDTIAFEHGAHVQTGAANQQRQLAPCGDVGNRGVGAVLKIRQRHLLVGRENVNEMVAGGGLFFGRGFGCADIHADVELARIGGDDFAVKGLRQRNGGCRFADGGRSDNRNQRRQVGLFVAHSTSTSRGRSLCKASMKAV